MTFIPNNDDHLWKEHKQGGWFRFSSPLKFVIFIILLVGLIVALWYLLSPARQTYNKTDLALIRADETPFKVKAKDQGIPGVKHQDKLVYGRIRGDQKDPPVEHILPDPEPATIKVKGKTAPLKMEKQYNPEDVNLETPPQDPSQTSHKSISSIEDLIADSPQEKPAPSKSEGKGTIFIQLGSLKNFDLAESEWARISKKHKDILGGLDPKIQKVDLGDEQGIYYRLRTGPFESEEKAKSACTTLKERKVNCIVIR